MDRKEAVRESVWRIRCPPRPPPTHHPRQYSDRGRIVMRDSRTHAAAAAAAGRGSRRLIAHSRTARGGGCACTRHNTCDMVVTLDVLRFETSPLTTEQPLNIYLCVGAAQHGSERGRERVVCGASDVHHGHRQQRTTTRQYSDRGRIVMRDSRTHAAATAAAGRGSRQLVAHSRTVSDGGACTRHNTCSMVVTLDVLRFETSPLNTEQP